MASRQASDDAGVADPLAAWFGGLGIRPAHLEKIAPLLHDAGATEPTDLADMMSDLDDGVPAIEAIVAALPVAKRLKFKDKLALLLGSSP